MVIVSLLGYTDYDWVGDALERMSTIGCIFQLGSSHISWSSKNLRTLSLSSYEVEYREVEEGMWIQHVLIELGLVQKYTTELRCDNHSGI